MTASKKHTLLVVDDEVDVCDSVHDLLRREFRVLKAKSADEGLKLMRENEVHIIMTDQRMPNVTGVELLRSIRAGHPQAIRMLFTGYADLDSVIAAINQGHIFKFLKKPGSRRNWSRLCARRPPSTKAHRERGDARSAAQRPARLARSHHGIGGEVERLRK